MYFLYSVFLTLAFTVLLPRFLLDALRHGKYAAGFRERMGAIGAVRDTRGRPVIWLHCVSVGETQAARPLARLLLERYPAHTLVVSTTTLTGQRLAREVFADEAAAIFYFPFDWAWTVRRALKVVNPRLVLVMETELWPHFLRECRARKIPVALVNGRISEASFRRYRLARPFIRRVVDNLSLAIMQTEADAARIAALGLAPERIRVSGNVKFDADAGGSETSVTFELRERFALDSAINSSIDASTLIVAASTHAPEERIVLEAFRRLRATARGRDARLLLAPRHPERFAEVAALLASSGFLWARRSAESAASDAACDVILLDSIGELRAVYPLATLVLVGGSIARVGGHNVLEPAAHARCIITGAHTSNFKAITRAFLEQDALVQLPPLNDGEAPAALARVFLQLLEDDERRARLGANAHAALLQSRGATERTVEMLSAVLDSEHASRDSPVPVSAEAPSRV